VQNSTPKYTVNEASSFSAMFRVTADGQNITQADVSDVRFAVLNDATKEVIQGLSSLSVEDVVFNTIQKDDRWSTDAVGYNLRHDISHTLVTDPSVTYRFEYRVTLAGSGNQFWLSPFVLNVREMFSN
jgi:hypothetical protein